MSPYLAVIRDSFHAALTSRVLWVAFLAIWLLLIGLAPIGYREDFTTSFRSQDFHNGTRLKAMLAQGLVDPKASDTPAARIAAALPDELGRQLRRVGQGDEVRIRVSHMADALNPLLDDERWFDADAWKSTLRFRELRELEERQDDLSESLRRRRARLRIEAAFPGVFETRAARSIMLTYAGFDFPANFALDKTQFLVVINQFVVPLIIEWLMGFVLVFLGILVTSSIVPDMLQPGSLHLLLSKPVSRTMLLLSKFLGGCAFVFLCVLQLVIGLYLIAGLRLDLWNARMLWCIPVSVFLFAVFYSVSTLAGLIWRSPILAIGVTTIFGTICLLVGIFGGLFDGLVTGPAGIQSLAFVGDDLFGATRGGGLSRYDQSSNRWVEILKSDVMGGDRVLPPIVLNDQTMATAQVRGGRLNPFGTGSLDLLVLNRSDNWSPEPSLRLPTATSMLMLAGDDVLAISTAELAKAPTASILAAAGSEKQENAEGEPVSTGSESDAQSSWFSKLSNMMGGATDGFSSILPPSVAITPPRSVVADPDGQWLIVMTRGRLVRLHPDEANPENPLQVVADRMLDGDVSRRGAVAVSENVMLVSRNEEPILIVDATSLQTLASVDLPKSLAPIAATGLGSGGRFLLLTSDGRCREVKPTKVNPINASSAGSESQSTPYELSTPLPLKSVESMHLDRATGRLCIAHHVDRVDVMDANDFSVQKQIRPSLASWRLVDRYLMAPLRMLVPQTGELGETIEAMVSGKSAVTIEDGSEQGQLIRYDIVRPVLSCAVFITVMLAVSCLFFASRDF